MIIKLYARIKIQQPQRMNGLWTYLNHVFTRTDLRRNLSFQYSLSKLSICSKELKYTIQQKYPWNLIRFIDPHSWNPFIISIDINGHYEYQSTHKKYRPVIEKKSKAISYEMLLLIYYIDIEEAKNNTINLYSNYALLWRWNKIFREIGNFQKQIHMDKRVIPYLKNIIKSLYLVNKAIQPNLSEAKYYSDLCMVIHPRISYLVIPCDFFNPPNFYSCTPELIYTYINNCNIPAGTIVEWLWYYGDGSGTSHKKLRIIVRHAVKYDYLNILRYRLYLCDLENITNDIDNILMNFHIRNPKLWSLKIIDDKLCIQNKINNKYFNI